MSDSLRRTAIMVIIAISMMAVLIFYNDVEILSWESRNYYLKNFISDTGAKNAVAAIYLNYRIFDTFFEALLLMISVTGIIYFLEEKGHDDTE